MQYFIMYLLGDFHDIGIMYAGALRPCIIFHKMISADVLSLEYIVSDGCYAHGGRFCGKATQTSHDAPFTNKLYGSPTDG